MKKKCTKCKEYKELKEFYRDKRGKDGYQCSCKKCVGQYYSEYKNERKEYQERYRSNHKEEIKEYYEKWYSEHRDEKLRSTKEYNLKYRDEINKYLRGRRRTNDMFRLSSNISGGMNRSLKSNKRGTHWEFTVPYEQPILKRHLERRFLPGMNWKNHGRGNGKWHIEHRRPIKSFTFENPEDLQFQVCWALENLWPIWEEDNFKKGSKIIENYQTLLEI